MSSKWVAVSFLFTLTLSSAAGSDLWQMGESAVIHPNGTRPDLWNGEIAFLEGSGGPVMFYNGSESDVIFESSSSCWEPQNANGSVAWRHMESGASSNEIYRWDGDSIINVSNSSGVVDCDLSGGSNGDLLWSKEHEDLMYYDLSEDAVIDLGVPGVRPSLYINDSGVATYAYQDPDTDEVFYFDGETTHLLGAGNSNGASPCVWDGAVAWVGQGIEGSYFTKGEIFFWKNGVVERITNDDEAGSGVADEFPAVWCDTVVWCRAVDSIFAPKLFIWDGYGVSQLTSETAKYPSMHHGKLAWVGDDGMRMADMYRSGDLDFDQDVDLSDLATLLGNYGDAGASYAEGDINGDGVVNADDLAILIALYGYQL